MPADAKTLVNRFKWVLNHYGVTAANGCVTLPRVVDAGKHCYWGVRVRTLAGHLAVALRSGRARGDVAYAVCRNAACVNPAHVNFKYGAVKRNYYTATAVCSCGRSYKSGGKYLLCCSKCYALLHVTVEDAMDDVATLVAKRAIRQLYAEGVL